MREYIEKFAKNLCLISVFAVLVFGCEIVIAKESDSNNSTKSNAQSNQTQATESVPYRPISENPHNDGLYVGFYYVGHNKTYQGQKPDIDKKSEYYEDVMLASAIGVGYYTSFLDKKVREWNNRQGVFGINWAGDFVDIKVPFYIYAMWSADTQTIVDKEKKSLCYSHKGFGCVFPYTPYIKNTKAYALPNLDSRVVYEIDSKKDIVFPIAQTGDKAFYQVIIFPSFMELKDFKSVEESYEFIQKERYAHGNAPINAFVAKSAIKKILPNHPLMRLDPQYADVPVFFTSPNSIHKIHLYELEKRGKK